MSGKNVRKVENLPRLTAAKREDRLVQRVAAYARVSTDKEEQQTSIVAQKEYYTDYIQSHKLLFYILHDVARKKIVAKDIRTAIVEFAAEVVSADRLNAIEQYMTDFETMSPWEMLSDADDLSFVIERILVNPDRSIEVLWLDGCVDRYEVPKYTPVLGIQN